jgi:hypothetical protein
LRLKRVNEGKGPLRDKVLQRHIIAAKCGFSYASKVECMAACCAQTSCPRSLDVAIEPTHDPVFECSYVTLFAWKNLLMVPTSLWPSYTKRVMCRYLPLLKIYFEGVHDKFDDIEAMMMEEMT